MRILFLLSLTAALGGCATYTDRTSPCVCDWQAINMEEMTA